MSSSQYHRTMPPSAHPLDWISLHGIVVLAGLLIYVAASHTLRQRRHPAAAIAWVITLVLVPYVGLPLYLVFGTRKLGRARTAITRATGDSGSDAEHDWPQRLAAAMDLAPAASFHSLRVHEDGKQALHALCEQVDSATRTLEICTYILGDDPMADALCEKLIHKVREGVKVRLLLDGVGRMLGGSRNRKALAAAGVDVALFVPPLHSPRRGRVNMRNHRKMVITDGAWLWCGGRNLTAEYFEGAPGVKAWKDLSFDLRGTLAERAHECFERDWAFATDGSRRKHVPPEETASG